MQKIFFILILNLVLAMNSQAQYITTVDTVSGEEILVGKVSADNLIDIKGFERIKQDIDFPLNNEQFTALKMALDDNVKVKAFIGTWCEDTHTYFPEFIQLMGLLEVDENNIEIIALDRSKKSEDGITEEYKIESVPTIIFIRDDDELGRFVEYPQSGSVTEDVYKILTKQ